MWLYEYGDGSLVGIDKVKTQFNPNIYSLNGNIHINNVENMNINSVQIYDMVGKLVFQTNTFQKVIVPNLPSSVYILRINSNQGEFVKKVAIQ